MEGSLNMRILKNLKLNKKLLRELDYITIIAAICIVIFGCVNIYSSTYKAHGNYYVKLQIIFLILGLIMIYLFLTFDYMLIENYAVIIYWAGVIFLIINHFFGSTVNGAKAWISVGSMAVQPSEFAKIGMIIIIAKKLDVMEGKINNSKTLLQLILYAAIPMILVFIQPDMGMTMVSFFIVLGIFFCVGLDWKILFGGITSILLILIGAWNSPIIKPYQKERLTAFLNPAKDTLGNGLQLVQSKIAIGSGGLMGRGFLKGVQFQNVPANHTDFIFAVLGEEWGLIGVIILLLL